MQSEIYDAPIEAGASEPKARAAAEAVAAGPKSDEVATKAELYRALWLQGAAIIGINIATAAFLASLIK